MEQGAVVRENTYRRGTSHVETTLTAAALCTALSYKNARELTDEMADWIDDYLDLNYG